MDTNILLYAEDSTSPSHQKARKWWDQQLSGTTSVCLCWTVILAYIRISTNSRIFKHPLSIQESIDRVQSWLNQPCVRLIDATQRHWEVACQMLLHGKAPANLVTDAHLAALAIEHGCELYSSDSDFSRFPKLKWRNPL